MHLLMFCPKTQLKYEYRPQWQTLAWPSAHASSVPAWHTGAPCNPRGAPPEEETSLGHAAGCARARPGASARGLSSARRTGRGRQTQREGSRGSWAAASARSHRTDGDKGTAPQGDEERQGRPCSQHCGASRAHGAAALRARDARGGRVPTSSAETKTHCVPATLRRRLLQCF